jgi:TolB-like protein
VPHPSIKLLAEEIAIAIARFPWFLVTACGKNPTVGDTIADVTRISHERGIRYLLKGSIRKAVSGYVSPAN